MGFPWKQFLHYLYILVDKGTMSVFCKIILCLASRGFLLRASDASEESLDKRIAQQSKSN